MRKVIESQYTSDYFSQVKDEYLSLFSNAEWQVLIEALEVSMEEWDTLSNNDRLVTGVWMKLQGIKQRIGCIETRQHLNK
jgi:hypothetical protein